MTLNEYALIGIAWAGFSLQSMLRDVRMLRYSRESIYVAAFVLGAVWPVSIPAPLIIGVCRWLRSS
jgi:hypothetical protein